MKVAVIQMTPGSCRSENMDKARGFLEEAASQGARMAVLPEMFSCFVAAEKWRGTAEEAGGGMEEFVRGEAERLGMYVVGGSYVERSGGEYFNTCPVASPEGEIVGRYRKMHLFWAQIGGTTRYDERSQLSAGGERFYFDADGFRVGVGICYDLRFPEFFREREGKPADIYCLPAAFMKATGEAHWEVLVRARAVENLAYFAAAGTVGSHWEVEGRRGERVETYGNSMVAGPWGEVVCRVREGEGVGVAEVTREAIGQARGRLGALSHRRRELWET